MITYKGPGDIFKYEADYLICPVNTVGTMGNGLALAFKMKFPELFRVYRSKCRSKDFTIHDILVYKGVICLPVKMEWWFPSRIEWVSNSLQRLAKYCRTNNVKRIVVPMIGAGYGQLDPSKVIEQVEFWLGDNLETEVIFLTKRAFK